MSDRVVDADGVEIGVGDRVQVEYVASGESAIVLATAMTPAGGRLFVRYDGGGVGVWFATDVRKVVVPFPERFQPEQWIKVGGHRWRVVGYVEADGKDGYVMQYEGRTADGHFAPDGGVEVLTEADLEGAEVVS